MKLVRPMVEPPRSARVQRILDKRTGRKQARQEAAYRALYPHLSDADYARLFKRPTPLRPVP